MYNFLLERSGCSSCQPTVVEIKFQSKIYFVLLSPLFTGGLCNASNLIRIMHRDIFQKTNNCGKVELCKVPNFGPESLSFLPTIP